MTPEGLVKKSICEYLDFRRDVLFWVQESQGTFDPRTKSFRKKKSKYQRNGIADIFVLLRVQNFPPVYIALEVKAGSNKQSESQIKMEKDLKAFGSFYFVVRTPEQAAHAITLVKKHIESFLPSRIDK